MAERAVQTPPVSSQIVVIHGPQRSGKTYYAKAFAEHYDCTTIVDADTLQRRDPIRPGTLVLAIEPPPLNDPRYDWATFVSIETARAAIGVGPVSSIPATAPRTARKPAVLPLAQGLALLGVKLPLRACPEYVGSVLDGAGEEIFVVDQHNEIPDERANAIAALLVAAVNLAACA